MKTLQRIALACTDCGRRVLLDGALLEADLGELPSVNNIGQLYGKLRCRDCGSRSVRIADETGLALIDPASLTRCGSCGFPIALPRLGAMPGTNVCGVCAAAGAKPRPAPAYPQPPADRLKCPRCGNPTVVRQNNEDQGYFLGCTGFPRCRWTGPFGA